MPIFVIALLALKSHISLSRGQAGLDTQPAQGTHPKLEETDLAGSLADMAPSDSLVRSLTRTTQTLSRRAARITHARPRAQNVVCLSHPRSERTLYNSRSSRQAAATGPATTQTEMAFPCLDAVESKTSRLSTESGPEPSYTTGAHRAYTSEEPLSLDWGGVLPSYKIAYETWGELNTQKSNAILLYTGLSASSHAHSTPENDKPGWWEKFIGPDKPLDTNKYFVICTNVLGGCYGSTGPSSINPATGRRYGTSFPILTMQDMVRAQFTLLDHLGIQKLHASVGSSMGGMQSLAAGVLFPERVGRIASISGCARSHPYSIAMRHTQRQVLMVDPNWKRGFYYDSVPPHAGMKLAREIATVTYRSGPEWEQRFGRRRADPSKVPALCPDFLIETYLDHAGEKWCLEYDANSLLYISKAMDLFDLGKSYQDMISKRRRESADAMKHQSSGGTTSNNADRDDSCSLSLPDKPYEEQPSSEEPESAKPQDAMAREPPQDLVAGLMGVSHIPALVMGVASDGLFPAWQQREIAETLRRAGNKDVTHVELGEDKSLFGHDTFLLDLDNVGGNLKRFLG